MALQRSGGTAYTVTGEGSTVILVHGLGLNHRMWQWQIDSLTPHFRVIAYDLLGHGESAKPGGTYKMQQMVGQLADLIDAVDAEECALVGFSLGGLIVQAFASAYPERVTALAILNAAHNRTEEQRESILQRVRQAEKEGPAATVDDALIRWFSREFAAEKPQIMNQVRRWVVANDPDTYSRVYQLLAEADIGLELAIGNIQCRTLVITGEEDYGNSPAMAQSMAALIPNARAVILPQLRHMALVEDPNSVNSLLIPFLQGSV